MYVLVRVCCVFLCVGDKVLFDANFAWTVVLSVGDEYLVLALFEKNPIK